MRALLLSLALLASLEVSHSAPGPNPKNISADTLKRESGTITSLHGGNTFLVYSDIQLFAKNWEPLRGSVLCQSNLPASPWQWCVMICLTREVYKKFLEIFITLLDFVCSSP